MRLLHTTELRLVEFIGKSIPPYVILSHTWGEDEPRFQDVHTEDFKKRKGFTKIKFSCEQAIKDEYDWIWIDTICIDKSSSAELSEAINSMYNWYKNSEICYVYLIDIPSSDVDKSVLATSRWFSRGWTLQELIAPELLEFYACDWSEMGTKRSLVHDLAKITGIRPLFLLDHDNLVCSNAAEKISWASKRQTSREEDIAYCLMGLLGVNMPLLYGEGGERAFLRLQEEVLKERDDHSLFTWTGHSIPNSPDNNHFKFGLLALYPARFCTCKECWKLLKILNKKDDFGPYAKFHCQGESSGIKPHYEQKFGSNDYTMITNRGVKIKLPLKSISKDTVLACLRLSLQDGWVVGIKLDLNGEIYNRLVTSDWYELVPGEDLERGKQKFEPTTLYISKVVENITMPCFASEFKMAELPISPSIIRIAIKENRSSGSWKMFDSQDRQRPMDIIENICLLLSHRCESSYGELRTIATFGHNNGYQWCHLCHVQSNPEEILEHTLTKLADFEISGQTITECSDRSTLALQCNHVLKLAIRRFQVRELNFWGDKNTGLVIFVNIS